MEHKEIVNIGNTDENADWIKRQKSQALERAAYEELAKQYAKDGK